MMDVKRAEKFKEIEDINNSPGFVFYGDISENGEVSQEVHDAGKHFDFLIQTIKEQDKWILHYKDYMQSIIDDPVQGEDAQLIQEQLKYALKGEES